MTIAKYGAFTVYVYEVPDGGYVASAAGGQGVPTLQAPEGGAPTAQSVQAALDALRRVLAQS